MLFGLLSGVKMYLFIGTVTAFGVLIGTFYWYYQDTQSTIETLRENNTKLESAVESKDATIARVKEKFEKQKSLTRKLQNEIQNSEERLTELRNILRKHDLTNLSLEKPGLIENKINRGTKDAFDAFEKETEIQP